MIRGRRQLRVESIPGSSELDYGTLLGQSSKPRGHMMTFRTLLFRALRFCLTPEFRGRLFFASQLSVVGMGRFIPR
jgi:hypothetical protein